MKLDALIFGGILLLALGVMIITGIVLFVYGMASDQPEISHDEPDFLDERAFNPNYRLHRELSDGELNEVGTHRMTR